MIVDKLHFIRLVHHKLKKEWDIKVRYWDVYYMIQAFIEVVVEIMEGGDTLKLSGLMTLAPHYKKSRKYNIGGAKYAVDEHYIPKAKFHKNIKDACQVYGELLLQLDKEMKEMEEVEE